MELLPGVHLVPGVRWSRAYLIEDETLTLVDTGPPWSARAIVEYVRSIGRRPEELKRVLITHSHFDHTASARSLIGGSQATVLTHQGDTRALGSDEVHLSYVGLLPRLRAPLPLLRGTPVRQTVADGQLLPVRGGVRVMHKPGHTSGSVCYLLEDEKVLFSGDTLFSDGGRTGKTTAALPTASPRWTSRCCAGATVRRWSVALQTC